MSKRIAVLAFDDVEELDLVGVYEVLAKTRRMKEDGGLDIDEPLQVDVLGLTEEVVCRNGLVIRPHHRYRGFAGYDILIVPGGNGVAEVVKDGALMADIWDFARQHLVCSVCTGAMVLAKAGLLEGKRATTHHEAREELRLYCEVSHERVVEDGNVITAGGISCSLDLGLALLERLFSREVAECVARRLALDSLGCETQGN